MKKGFYKSRRKSFPAAVTIILSFISLIIIGTALFTLPIMTKDAKGLPFFTALFTATSSVCVTGLSLFEPAVTLSLSGQMLMCLLVEIGGISMVTFVTFFMFSFRKKSPLRSVRLAKEYTNIDDFSKVKSLVRTVVFTAVMCQLIGACIFSARFVPKYGLKGLWLSVFTAVSAYCNAGFDLFSPSGEFGSFSNFTADPLVMLTVMGLVIVGGIGFFVFYDIITCKKNKHLTLHTRIVLIFTVFLILFGLVAFLLCEYDNEKTLLGFDLKEKIMLSLFQSVSSRTAGFSGVDIAATRPLTKMIMMLLMFIGSGSGSTGGGVKITTFSVILLSIKSVIKGDSETTVFSHRIDNKTVTKSMAIVFLSFSFVFLLSCILFVDCPNLEPVNIVFEAVSVFSTAGFTVGVTANASAIGLIAIIFAMLIGRVGPVAFVLALSSGSRDKPQAVQPEGKIILG